jgi:ribonuclease BN (tRNA processing enzyme)
VSAANQLEVVVLGSGGAIPGRRAPSAYLVRQGRERILVDAGASALERLVEVEVSARDLDLIALTHGHLDHTGGLAPVLFGAWMDGREHAVSVAGPAGNDRHPGLDEICERLFGEAGAWRYLRDFTGFGLDLRIVPLDRTAGDPPLWSGDALTVRAVPVPHGSMPTVAYRVDGPHGSVCFSGDIGGQDDGLVELARGADVLVHDQAIAHRTADPKGNHPLPEETAANAARAGVGHLVLSHLTPDSENHLDEVLARVRGAFPGEVTVAADLQTLAVGGT